MSSYTEWLARQGRFIEMSKQFGIDPMTVMQTDSTGIEANVIDALADRMRKRTEREAMEFMCNYIQDNPEATVVYGQWVRSGDSHYAFVPATFNADGIYMLPTSDRTIVSLDLVKFKQMLQNGEI